MTGVDELDADGAKDVLSFSWGAPPSDAAAKVRKHLQRDIESKIEEGGLSDSLQHLAWQTKCVRTVYLTTFWLTHSTLSALEIGCPSDPHTLSAMRAQCEEALAQLQSTNEA